MYIYICIVHIPLISGTAPPSTPRHFPWKRPVKLVDLPCQFLDLPCQFSARCHDLLAS